MKASGWAALAGGALTLGLGLAIWRRDIPFAVLRARYGDASSRLLPLPGGVRLHLRERGARDGPVLLCLHGYSASGLEWESWADRLGHRYRLLLVDLPGHGLTEAPPGTAAAGPAVVRLLDALIGRLGGGPVVLVGNSMGGQVAWHYALAHPERVSALVLVAAVGGAEGGEARRPPGAVFRLLASRAGRFVLRHLDVTPLVRRGLARALGDPALVTEALVRRTADLARAPGHRAILTDLQLAPPDPALLRGLADFSKPTLVMAGADDALVPAAHATRFAKLIPGADLIVYPGVGHVPMVQIPARSAADLDAWLRRNGLG